MVHCSLSRHVYVCFTEEAAVFLDLKRSKYLGLHASHVPALRTLIEREGSTNDKSSQLADELVAQGLLTRNDPDARSSPIASLAPASATLDDEDADFALDSRERIRAHHVLNLLRSYALATILWRCLPLTYAVDRVRARKARAPVAAAEFDVATARELVRIFHRIRPFVYAAQQRCLVDTLTLLEFLARYAIFPTWMFGVRTRPFEAHTWLQQDGFVLNDHPAHTNAYTPILAV